MIGARNWVRAGANIWVVSRLWVMFEVWINVCNSRINSSIRCQMYVVTMYLLLEMVAPNVTGQDVFIEKIIIIY